MRTLARRVFFLLSLSSLLLCLPCAHAADPASNDYRLGAGDDIRVFVYRSPDMTFDARVSESGEITYPLIGTIRIGTLTIPQAESKIADALREGGIVTRPNFVHIVLQTLRGSQVSVLGQVNHPGRVPLETTDTRVSEVLAIAGGIVTATPGSVGTTGAAGTKTTSSSKRAMLCTCPLRRSTTRTARYSVRARTR